MPYNTDPRRLEQLIPYLAPLAEGRPNVEWQVTHGSPNTVAYRIREALHIARLNPDKYPDLAKNAPDYAIAVKGPTTVTARRKTPVNFAAPVETLIVQPTPTQGQEVDLASLRRQPVAFSAPYPTGSNANSVGTFATDGPQTPDSIIEIWSKGGSVKRTLFFPDARLNNRGMCELWLWAEKNNVMIMAAESAITLAVYDPSVAEFSFKPSPAMLEYEFGDKD